MLCCVLLLAADAGCTTITFLLLRPLHKGVHPPRHTATAVFGGDALVIVSLLGTKGLRWPHQHTSDWAKHFMVCCRRIMVVRSWSTTVVWPEVAVYELLPL